MLIFIVTSIKLCAFLSREPETAWPFKLLRRISHTCRGTSYAEAEVASMPIIDTMPFNIGSSQVIAIYTCKCTWCSNEEVHPVTFRIPPRIRHKSQILNNVYRTSMEPCMWAQKRHETFNLKSSQSIQLFNTMVAAYFTHAATAWISVVWKCCPCSTLVLWCFLWYHPLPCGPSAFLEFASFLLIVKWQKSKFRFHQFTSLSRLLTFTVVLKDASIW